MFTGIVESVGEVLSLKEDKDSWVLRLSLPFSGSDGLGQGESLSVNGCCLTLREDADEEEDIWKFWFSSLCASLNPKRFWNGLDTSSGIDMIITARL